MSAHRSGGAFAPMSLLTLSFTLVRFRYLGFTVEDSLEVCSLSRWGKV